MKILNKILGKPAKEVIDSIGNILDNTITSKEEKLQAFEKIEKLIQDNLTARHAADMASDSWLSKNIRPLALIAIFVMYCFMALADGNWGLMIQEGYVTLLGDWGKLAFGFYFGMRGFEKIAQIRSKK